MSSILSARQLSLLALILHLPLNGSLVHASRTGPVQYHATTAMALTELVKLLVALVFAHGEAARAAAGETTAANGIEEKGTMRGSTCA